MTLLDAIFPVAGFSTSVGDGDRHSFVVDECGDDDKRPRLADDELPNIELVVETEDQNAALGESCRLFDTALDLIG